MRRLSSILPVLVVLLAIHIEVCKSQLGSGSHNDPSWGAPDTGYCGTTGSCSLQRQAAASVNDIYVKGVPSVFFMQLLYSNRTVQIGNGTTSTVGDNSIMTSSFFPLVDQYSELTVPGSFSYIRELTSATQVPRIQMVMYFRGQLFKSGPLAWSKLDGDLYYVPARTLVVTLSDGVPTSAGSLSWAQTDCALAACECIDNICGATCTNSTQCDIKVRVGWAGTDGNGNILTSASLDIWRFQNAF